MSSIINAGKVVFAKELIPKMTRIGPYKGDIVKKDVNDETDTSYFWEGKYCTWHCYSKNGLSFCCYRSELVILSHTTLMPRMRNMLVG